jgi:pilus assembly protein Flp/PilA
MMKKFMQCEAGATAIEYGLIAAGIAVAIAVVVFSLGSKLNTLFSNINSMLP